LHGEKGVKRLRRIGIILVLLFAICSLQFVPSGYLAIYPGPVIHLSDVVEVRDSSRKEDSFYMVSILAKDASVLEFFKAAVDGKAGLWSKKQVFGGKSIDEYMEANWDLMMESQKTATYIALKTQGIAVQPQGPFPVDVRIRSGKVAGPSAGLAFALEILNQTGHDIVRGRRIACTGILDSEGRILGVGGVPQKTIACRNEGIEILLVPRPNYNETLGFAGDMTVFGVSTFDEALRVLSEEGNP
jgi:PDZ domain-containing secreted protein